MSHGCVGATDEITRTKVCNEANNPWVLVDVKDNDEAAITMKPSLFILNVNEEARVLDIHLQTRPERIVQIDVLLSSAALELVHHATSKSMLIQPHLWNNKTCDIIPCQTQCSGSESQITF